MIKVLTIEREYGSGAATLPKSSRTGWAGSLWDQLLTDEIARHLECESQHIEQHEERKGPAVLSPLQILPARQLRRKPERPAEDGGCRRHSPGHRATGESAASEGNCVIVGAARRTICTTSPMLPRFHVRAVRRQGAPAAAKGKSEEEAMQLAETVDPGRRAAFIKQYFGIEWPARQFFHLMVNSTMGDEAVVQKQHAHHEIQPELVTQLGAAPDAILSFAQARKTDLVVMGTHGRRGYDRLILGSVTDRVMRKAPCPVIAVSKPPNGSSAESQDRGHTHHLSRILFCADFSEAARRTLDYAISVRAEYDAELTLLHVLEHVPSPARTEEAIAAAKEQLGSLIPSEERQTAKIKTAVRLGKPYRQIIQLALEEQIDLVAMGVRGHGALDLAVFGSTTYRVIQLGPCPVLVHV
jgi:nucleotide-binding universal stress UspA family protein